MTRHRGRALLGICSLSLVAFVLSHQLIFVATYGDGFGAALARTGHGDDWTMTVASVAVLALCLAAAAVRQLRRLSREVTTITGHVVDVRDGRSADLLRDVLRLWLAVLPLSLALFVMFENLETAAQGLAAPGLVVLGSAGYHDALLIFGAVTLVIAFVAGLYRWRRDVLVARIAEARRRWPHAPSGQPLIDPGWELPRPSSLVDRRPPGRAPPSLAFD